MAIIKKTTKGSFKHTLGFLQNGINLTIAEKKLLMKYGEKGLNLLREVTPKRTGKTSESWSYQIIGNSLVFSNSNKHKNFLVVLGLEYGHVAKDGGYIQGKDFLRSSVKRIFDQLAEEFYKEGEVNG